MKSPLFIVVSVLSVANSLHEPWMLGPFSRFDEENPVLTPLSQTKFYCPIQKREVQWESKDVFNPAAITANNSVFLLYRAEDKIGKLSGTSRIGLAESSDGIRFMRQPQPILHPAEDFMKDFEWEGGIEDPRVVRSDDGRFIMTYTAYNGVARLCIATSYDLVSWTKHGPAFGNGKFKDLWTKSGAIVTQLSSSGELIAARSGSGTLYEGYFLMYWGEHHIQLAISKDLIHWDPVEEESGESFSGRPEHSMVTDNNGNTFKFVSVLGPRKGSFDSELVEPGPPPLMTQEGILLIYNSKNKWCMYAASGECNHGESDAAYAPGSYSAGQVLLTLEDPTKIRHRSAHPFLSPSMSYEVTGQVNHVVFLEGLTFYKGEWFIYYGTADSKIAVARTRLRDDEL